MKKIAVFRADSATRIGSGHVMRCLTLAIALKQHNYKVIFLCKPHKGNINKLIQAQFELIELSDTNQTSQQALQSTNTADWLGSTQHQDAHECISALHKYKSIELMIVDHYSLDKLWQNELKHLCNKTVVIDDLANRQHSANFLIDQTFGRSQADYTNLVPDNCEILCGSSIIMLREEFKLLREKAQQNRKQTEKIDKILVSMGGTDPDNLTKLAITSLIKYQQHNTNLSVEVILTSVSPCLTEITSISKKYTWLTLTINCNNMAERILEADLAIGASGSSAWERCCLGLPTLTMISAENQQEIDNNLSKKQATISLGWYNKISEEKIVTTLKNLNQNLEHYHHMVEQSFQVCDGLGVDNILTKLLKGKK
jgi:UDP-2,4-diacetamido-2,4,6-trideoxy-beta-L-altropyranose hydrolase